MKDEQIPTDGADNIPNTPLPVIWTPFIVYPNTVKYLELPGEELDALLKRRDPGKHFLVIAISLKEPKHNKPQSKDDFSSVGTIAEVRTMAIQEKNGKFAVPLVGGPTVHYEFDSDDFMSASPSPLNIDGVRPDDAGTRALLTLFIEKIGEFAKDQNNRMRVFTNAIMGGLPFVKSDSSPELVNRWLDIICCDFAEGDFGISYDDLFKAFMSRELSLKLNLINSFFEQVIRFVPLKIAAEAGMNEEMEKRQNAEIYSRIADAAGHKSRELLGGPDSAEEDSPVEVIRKKIESLPMPDEARKEALRECGRFSGMPSQHPEYSIVSTYLDWMIGLPWGKESGKTISLENSKEAFAVARNILNRDHYSLRKVKERLIESLSVRCMNPNAKSSIICFIGPPGVGKTSLGKSIAEALGRKFVRESLGGLHDEAEIKGHRRTYIGAMPGKIIQGIKRAGFQDPVFMLDEIDKIGKDFRGDPAAALLEVLDPEQNVEFKDHYLGVPFDLSKVLFICTGNQADPIIPALLDRLELIHLDGYTDSEKLQIAIKHLIPKQINEHGLKDKETNRPYISIPSEEVGEIIRGWTRESGVRSLEKRVATICRKVATKIAEGDECRNFEISSRNLPVFLGPPKNVDDYSLKEEVGVVNFMGWTPVGGAIETMACLFLPKGNGRIELTGSLGKIMTESAKAAVSHIRSRAEEFGISQNLFNKYDVHIHADSAAIEKEGPSAGVPLALVVLSAATGFPILSNVAATGEITLKGRVRRVGGLKEKFLAAYRKGLRVVCYPKGNDPEVKELLDDPDNAELKELNLMPIESVDEAIRVAIRFPDGFKFGKCKIIKKRGKKNDGKQ